MEIIAIYSLMKKIFKSEDENKNVYFPNQFSLGSIPKKID